MVHGQAQRVLLDLSASLTVPRSFCRKDSDKQRSADSLVDAVSMAPEECRGHGMVGAVTGLLCFQRGHC